MKSPYTSRHELLEGTLINDGFFPDLDLKALQKRYQIDSQVTLERLSSMVLSAVILTNRELNTYACSQLKKGYQTLADVPFMTYALALPNQTDSSLSGLVHLYETAIFARVQGDLARESSTHRMSVEGKRRQENDYNQVSDDFYRQSVWAVRQIKSKRTTRVRLI